MAKNCGEDVSDLDNSSSEPVRKKIRKIRLSDEFVDLEFSRDPALNFGGIRLNAGQYLDPAMVKWMRPKEVFNAPVFYPENDEYVVSQGLTGVCWLMSVLISLSDRPELLRVVIGRRNNLETGSVTFNLFSFGTWKEITVDTLIPVLRADIFSEQSDKNLFVFTETTGPKGELWAALLQKAMAKIFGSYRALEGGQSATGWLYLTRCLTQELRPDSYLQSTCTSSVGNDSSSDDLDLNSSSGSIHYDGAKRCEASTLICVSSETGQENQDDLPKAVAAHAAGVRQKFQDYVVRAITEWKAGLACQTTGISSDHGLKSPHACSITGAQKVSVSGDLNVTNLKHDPARLYFSQSEKAGELVRLRDTKAGSGGTRWSGPFAENDTRWDRFDFEGGKSLRGDEFWMPFVEFARLFRTLTIAFIGGPAHWTHFPTAICSGKWTDNEEPINGKNVILTRMNFPFTEKFDPKWMMDFVTDHASGFNIQFIHLQETIPCRLTASEIETQRVNVGSTIFSSMEKHGSASLDASARTYVVIPYPNLKGDEVVHADYVLRIFCQSNVNFQVLG